MSAPEDDDEAGAAGAATLSEIQKTTRPPRDLWTDEQTEVLKQVLMEAAGKKNWFQITHAYNQKARKPHEVMASQSDEAISNSLNAVFKRPYSYMARLEVQYEINH